MPFQHIDSAVDAYLIVIKKCKYIWSEYIFNVVISKLLQWILVWYTLYAHQGSEHIAREHVRVYVEINTISKLYWWNQIWIDNFAFHTHFNAVLHSPKRLHKKIQCVTTLSTITRVISDVTTNPYQTHHLRSLHLCTDTHRPSVRPIVANMYRVSIGRLPTTVSRICQNVLNMQSVANTNYLFYNNLIICL